MSGTTRKRGTRLATAVLLAVSMIAVGIAPSFADPGGGVDASRAQLDAARTKLAELQHKFEQLVEEYNGIQVQLDETERKLGAAEGIVEKAADAADAAQAALATRTVAAYQGGTGTALDLLLGSEDFTEFADRLEFLNQVAASDADIAAEAQVTGEEARRAADDLHSLKLKQQEQIDTLAQAKEDISKSMDETEALVEKYQLQYEDAVAAAKAAAAAAAAADQQNTGRTDGGTDGGYSNPPTSSGAAGAVAAARSMIGKPYVWGAASPGSGFDCSGLTSWAWGQVGVYLPHYSAAQYSSLPKVSKDALQPGDLLFFYSPISHVAMYTGGGMMVHATSPGTPVKEEPIAGYWWDVYVGATRPG